MQHAKKNAEFNIIDRYRSTRTFVLKIFAPFATSPILYFVCSDGVQPQGIEDLLCFATSVWPYSVCVLTRC